MLCEDQVINRYGAKFFDFVVTEERYEWENNGKNILEVIKEQLK